MNGSKDNQLIVLPHGDLDLYASVAFCNAILPQFNRSKNHLVLDLSATRYLDSSGVGTLIRLAQHAKTISGEVKLANLTGTPRKVLEMSNIIRLFHVYSNVKEALTSWE